MRTLLLSFGDTAGGASRAAFRLHRALRTSGVDSWMKVRVKTSDEWTVEGTPGALGPVASWARQAVGKAALSLQRSEQDVFRSANLLPSAWSREIETMAWDVVNVHWIGSEAVSIGDLGRVHVPSVWTLHDMWSFCGTEHYAPEGDREPWVVGYDGLPLNRWLDAWVWRRKVRCWRRPRTLVAPSRWLAELVKRSALMRHWPVHVIPNALDVNVFKPLDKRAAREALGISAGRPVILFGAVRPARDTRKGLDLLVAALRDVASTLKSEEPMCVVFGQSAPREQRDIPLEVAWMGFVHDEVTLALLYSAADVTVVPSRQENLPQTATEAAACGCPVVAFDTGGLPDAVEHETTGYLARPFAPDALAEGIRWVLEDGTRRARLSLAARERAVRLWAPHVVVPRYLEVFESAKGERLD